MPENAAIQPEHWQHIAHWFDQLCELAPDQRQLALDEAPAEIATDPWLLRLLQAHDEPQEGLWDNTLSDLLGCLQGDEQGTAQQIPQHLGGQDFGNWRAESEIARGGMAVVFRGVRSDGHFEKTVAIKVLPPGPFSSLEGQRLSEEVRILARLEHPHIARLIDGGVNQQGWPYLIMECVNGQSILQHAQGLSLDQRLQLWHQAAQAVAHAHQHLVVHSDIKGANVLVNEEGQVKLVDFGIASLLQRGESHPQQPWRACSPATAAPEQLRGAPPSTSQDIFGLGALLYQLCCECPIRDQRHTTQLLLNLDSPAHIPAPPSQQARAQRLGWAHRLNRELDAIVLRALATEPAQRYASVTELCQDLRRWAQQRPVRAYPGGRLYATRKWFLRNRWLASAALLTLLSLSTGIGVAWWQARAARAEAALSGATRDFLLDMFTAVDPWINQRNPVTADTLVEQAIQRLPRQLHEHPHQRGEILHTLGELQRRLGHMEQARDLHLEATTLLPLDTISGMRARAGLANDYLDLLDFESAAGVLDELLPRETWPPQQASAVQARLLQIQLLTRQGNLEAQQSLLNEMLNAEDSIARLPEGAELLADLYLMAAETHENLADYPRALGFAQRAYTQAERAFGGAHHPLVARALSYQATTWHAQGNYPAALKALTDFLEVAADYYGPDHPETRWGQYTQARVLTDAGEFAAAISIYEQLEQVLLREYGAEDPRLGLTYANLGKAWRGLGEYQRAIDYFQRGLPLTAQAGQDHPKLGTYYAVYAQSLSEAGQSSQASDYFQRSLSILANKLGPEHPAYASAQVLRGEHLLRQGQLGQAARELAQAHQNLSRQPDPNHPHLALAALYLAQAYRQGAPFQSGQTQAARNPAEVNVEASVTTTLLQQAYGILSQPRYRKAYQGPLGQIEAALAQN